MQRTIIGIDPDAEKSGIAVLCAGRLTLTTLPFVEAVRFVAHQHPDLVIIEAGWLNASNWHLRRGQSPYVVAKIGQAVGRNQQTGILLCETLRALGYTVREQKPLTKAWRGHDRKITHAEFCALTGYDGKHTNQEQRDAGLLAWLNK